MRLDLNVGLHYFNTALLLTHRSRILDAYATAPKVRAQRAAKSPDVVYNYCLYRLMSKCHLASPVSRMGYSARSDRRARNGSTLPLMS